jgi:hypothetical protein
MDEASERLRFGRRSPRIWLSLLVLFKTMEYSIRAEKFKAGIGDEQNELVQPVLPMPLARLEPANERTALY